MIAYIYGTLITIVDAFSRCFINGILILNTDDESTIKADNYHKIMLVVLGVGGFILLSLFKGGMIQILQFATIIGFVTAPIIAWLNLRTTQQLLSESQPSKALYYLAFVGLIAISLFALYYFLENFL